MSAPLKCNQRENDLGYHQYKSALYFKSMKIICRKSKIDASLIA